MMPDSNRLTRTYLGMWKQFQGLYLVAGDGDDVCLHSQQSERMAALVGMLSGFALLGGQAEPLTDLQVDVMARALPSTSTAGRRPGVSPGRVPRGLRR